MGKDSSTPTANLDVPHGTLSPGGPGPGLELNDVSSTVVLHAPAIPGYEILKQLGQGGMGVVYLAQQAKPYRLVALKMLRDKALVDASELERFQAEAQILSQFQHPHIVQVFEVGELEGHPFFAMEYVPGGSLAQCLQKHPLPPRDAAEITRVLALAMQAAHDQGIIHRDLKPANVLLAVNDHPSAINPVVALLKADSSKLTALPKIADFGMAKRLDAEGLTQTGIILGTPEYMAPEQAMGLSQVQGPAVDIYALGAILYELLTGRPPFRGATPIDTVQQVLMDEVVPPTRLVPKTPRDLETICLKCLHKEALCRYVSAQALAADLQRFLEGKPILARPIGMVAQCVKWARRKPALAGLTAMVLAVMCLLAVSVALLLRANAEESKQRQLAQESERRARSNAQLARQALDGLSIAMTEQAPFNEEPMRAARMKLLEQALRFYERFEADLGNDQQALEDAATHRFRLAVLTEEIGSKEKAALYYGQAVRLWEKLAAAHPREPRYRQEGAKSLTHLGQLRMQLGHAAAAAGSLGQAYALYQQLLVGEPTSAVDLAGLAEVRSHLGLHHFTAGRLPEAEDSYHQALQLLEQLIKVQPQEYLYRSRRAATLNRLGLLYENSARRPQAIEHFQQALQAYQEVIAAQPGVSTHQAELASVCNNLCTSFLRRRAWSQAEEWTRQEVPILERLTLAYPEVTDYHARLAAAWNRRGTLQRQLEQFPEAADSFQRARELCQRLVQRHPEVLDYQMQLGQVWQNLGLLAEERRQPTEALAHYAKAQPLADAMLSKHPRDMRVREQCKLLHRAKAYALEMDRRPGEALQEWDQALVLADRRPVEYLHHRGVCLARIGDIDGALAAAAEVSAHATQHGKVLFELARIHALCLPLARDAQEQERIAAAALQALSRAREERYIILRNPEMQKLLQDGADFTALRLRPDFQTFLRTLPPPEYLLRGR